MGRLGGKTVRVALARAAAVLLVCVAVVGVGAVPAAAASQYRFFQFNTAGNVRYGGDVQAATASPTALSRFVRTSPRSTRSV